MWTTMAGHIDGKFMSAFVRATKPAKCFRLLCAYLLQIVSKPEAGICCGLKREAAAQ